LKQYYNVTASGFTGGHFAFPGWKLKAFVRNMQCYVYFLRKERPDFLIVMNKYLYLHNL
jgi:hypothetical protein